MIEGFIQKYLDSHVGSIEKDHLTRLNDPLFPEDKVKKRYVGGFKDIIMNHFVKSDLQK